MSVDTDPYAALQRRIAELERACKVECTYLQEENDKLIAWKKEAALLMRIAAAFVEHNGVGVPPGIFRCRFCDQIAEEEEPMTHRNNCIGPKLYKLAKE